MTRPFDLIMFDLDGTLIETAPEIADAVNDTLHHFNLPAVTQRQGAEFGLTEYISEHIGLGVHMLSLPRG